MGGAVGGLMVIVLDDAEGMEELDDAAGPLLLPDAPPDELEPAALEPEATGSCGLDFFLLMLTTPNML